MLRNCFIKKIDSNILVGLLMCKDNLKKKKRNPYRQSAGGGSMKVHVGTGGQFTG